MIRLIDGAHEEQHVFNVTGMSWRKELADERPHWLLPRPSGFQRRSILTSKPHTSRGIICIISAAWMRHDWALWDYPGL